MDAEQKPNSEWPSAEVVGRQIKKARDKRGWKLERMAALIDVSLDTYKRYEKGQTDPSAIDVWKIACETGTPFAWFAGQNVSYTETYVARLDRLETKVGEARSLMAAIDEQIAELLVQARNLSLLPDNGGFTRQEDELPGSTGDDPPTGDSSVDE